MDLAGWSATGDPVPAVRGGIVSRRELFERLGGAARVTEVSAPAGSGKTFLLRSWIGEPGVAGRAAWYLFSLRSAMRSGSGCRYWTPCGARRPDRRWSGS
jgi:hypothetical protein